MKHWRDYKPGELIAYRGRDAIVVGYDDADRIVIRIVGASTEIATDDLDPALGAENEAEYEANLKTLRRALSGRPWEAA